MRSSGVIKVLYVVRKASQYKTRSAKQKQKKGEYFSSSSKFQTNKCSSEEEIRNVITYQSK